MLSYADDTLAAVWEDRDLGWLEFNRRVLVEATDERTPLLDRAKFLAIFSSNLDEFFMKRMAVVRESPVAADVRARLLPMLEQQAAYFTGTLVPALAAHGIHLKSWSELSPAQQREAGEFFDTQVSPALTPLVIHPAQPFPFFSNLSLSQAFVLHDDRSGETVHARVKVPSDLQPWVALSADVPAGHHVLVCLHEVIRENAHKLYPGMRLSASTVFRLTRDAEVEIEDDADQSLLELVREQVRQRRYEPVVRLEFSGGADRGLREMLQARFGLTDRDIYDLPADLDFTSLFQIAAIDAPALRDVPWTPLTPAALVDEPSIFDIIARGDLLLHHPYDSFDESVERFIRSAADDPATVAIKMTVYRVGDDTPFVRSLIRAAEVGKQVACVIELKARFDEARNLHWAQELERAGAHVSVGNATLKTHAKVALVVRRERTGLRVYAHIGTGNYHVRTARLYADIGLLTCNPEITADVVNLFHHLTGRSDPPAFRQLLVAPAAMRQRFQALVAEEIAHHAAGRPARIIAKLNQLEDAEMIAAICDASRAGVPVDLIIRGFSCLRPGVPGHTEQVRVRSIIGRFLEHSRIYHFTAGQRDPVEGRFYIGSADWMHRNLSGRVEVVAPVLARAGREQLWDVLDVLLKDERQAWRMEPDGRYTQLRPRDTERTPASLGTHQTLIERARQRQAQIP